MQTNVSILNPELKAKKIIKCAVVDRCIYPLRHKSPKQIVVDVEIKLYKLNIHAFELVNKMDCYLKSPCYEDVCQLNTLFS